MLKFLLGVPKNGHRKQKYLISFKIFTLVKNVLVKHKEAFSEAQIEFQIWTGAAVEESKLAHTIEINEKAIKGTSGTTDYLQYKIVVTDIANKYKVIKVSLKYDEEPANAFREWKIVAKNLQGESDPVIVKPTKEAFLSKWTEWSSCSISCLASDDVNAQMGERSKSRECTPGEEKCLKGFEVMLGKHQVYKKLEVL